MEVSIWGARGSLPAPGPETSIYGGNTSCIQVMADDTLLILDAGTGIRRLGRSLPLKKKRIDILLTHLHLDHIQGLGFFRPLYDPSYEIYIWGPASSTQGLKERLNRYLSPPIFPVRVRDFPCKLHLITVDYADFNIGPFRIQSNYVCHPGPTLGYRISANGTTLAYIPDHEPALGVPNFPYDPLWTSGFEIAKNVDLLIHDGQFTSAEYKTHLGWGHSSIQHALDFAQLAMVKQLLLFHHDPDHSDKVLDRLLNEYAPPSRYPFSVQMAREGATYYLSVSV